MTRLARISTCVFMASATAAMAFGHTDGRSQVVAGFSTGLERCLIGVRDADLSVFGAPETDPWPTSSTQLFEPDHGYRLGDRVEMQVRLAEDGQPWSCIVGTAQRQEALLRRDLLNWSVSARERLQADLGADVVSHESPDVTEVLVWCAADGQALIADIGTRHRGGDVSVAVRYAPSHNSLCEGG